MTVPRFIRLRPGEDVLSVVRPHPVSRIGAWFAAAFLLLLPFFLLFPLMQYGPRGIAVFGALLAAGLLVAAVVRRTWAGTLLVVTDRRVIDVVQSGLFGRQVTDVGYARVDEVARERRGAFAALFRYGTLRVVTSGEAADIEFAHAPDADRLADLIESARDRALARKTE